MKLHDDILNQIKQIEIHTRRLLRGTLIGDYSSAQKGSGLEFDQIREYAIGDDVRFIDWKSSARNQKLLVKQYIEERNRTVMLIVDRSASTAYGSSNNLKEHVIAQIASVLALVAECGKDHVGVIIGSNDSYKVMMPRSGRSYIHEIMHQIFMTEVVGKMSLNSALQKLSSIIRKDAIVFIVSDFLDTGYDKLLKIMAKHHDIVAVRCFDKFELALPPVGFLPVFDVENNIVGCINSCDELYNNWLINRWNSQKILIKSYGVDIIDINVGDNFVGPLIRFFRQRMVY